MDSIFFDYLTNRPFNEFTKMQLFVFAPAGMCNTVLFDAVVEGAGSQAKIFGSVFLNPEVFLKRTIDELLFFLI